MYSHCTLYYSVLAQELLLVIILRVACWCTCVGADLPWLSMAFHEGNESQSRPPAEHQIQAKFAPEFRRRTAQAEVVTLPPAPRPFAG